MPFNCAPLHGTPLLCEWRSLVSPDSLVSWTVSAIPGHSKAVLLPYRAKWASISRWDSLQYRRSHFVLGQKQSMESSILEHKASINNPLIRLVDSRPLLILQSDTLLWQNYAQQLMSLKERGSNTIWLFCGAVLVLRAYLVDLSRVFQFTILHVTKWDF